MAGFEVVVRPVVFPDIRPRSKPSIAPQDDPTKGFAVIQGNPAQAVGLSESWSISSSQSRPVETQRRVDETRVYQMEDSGTINRNNFVDVEVANRISFRGFNGDDATATVPGRGFSGDDLTQYFQPVKEAPNIEIKKRNKILKAEEDSE